MKIIEQVLVSRPLRPVALARLVPSRLSLVTHTRLSCISTSPFTLCNKHHTLQRTQQPSNMPPPPKRKWPRGRGGGGGGGGDRANGGAATSGTSTPRSTMAQQPKRPKMEDTQTKADTGVDVRQMYTTAAGDAAPKPFSELKDRLHKGLLDGLDKMGFE